MKNKVVILPYLDILVLFLWGALLFKYWVTGQLKLLIHPNYFGSVLVTSIILLVFSILKTGELFKNKRPETSKDVSEHLSLFPVGWGNGLLIITAILGFLISPNILTSQAAIQRGVSESLPITRNQPQTFRLANLPEERSLIDWIRTLNAYPEPDAYTGQKAKFTGFVVHLPQLPENYFLICRFIITCCAVDAYPVGIPVKISQSRNDYPPDTWIEIEGNMITENLDTNTHDKRQLVLVANSLKKIATPADPYSY